MSARFVGLSLVIWLLLEGWGISNTLRNKTKVCDKRINKISTYMEEICVRKCCTSTTHQTNWLLQRTDDLWSTTHQLSLILASHLGSYLAAVQTNKHNFIREKKTNIQIETSLKKSSFLLLISKISLYWRDTMDIQLSYSKY